MNLEGRPKWAKNWHGWRARNNHQAILACVDQDGKEFELWVSRIPSVPAIYDLWLDDDEDRPLGEYVLEMCIRHEDPEVLRRIAETIAREIGVMRTP